MTLTAAAANAAADDDTDDEITFEEMWPRDTLEFVELSAGGLTLRMDQDFNEGQHGAFGLHTTVWESPLLLHDLFTRGLPAGYFSGKRVLEVLFSTRTFPHFIMPYLELAHPLSSRVRVPRWRVLTTQGVG